MPEPLPVPTRASPPVWAGLFITCVALPWLNPMASGPSPGVLPWLVCASCTALLWLVGGALRVQRPALVGLVALPVAAVSGPGGLSPEVAALAGACLVIGVCAGVASGWPQRERLASWIAIGWLAAAGISCVFALSQYFGWADALAPFVTVPAAPEAYANLRQRNQLASLVAIGMAALLWLAGRGLPLRHALAGAVLLAIGSAATTSRTGALQLIVVAAAMLAWAATARPRLLAISGAAMAAYLAAALALPGLQEAVTGVPALSLVDRVAGSPGCSSRLVLWSNVLDLIAERPGLGWGWGELDYAHLTHLYPGDRFCDILDNAHNLPLHLAVEFGLPFAGLLCAAFAALVARGAPWRERDPVRQLAWAVLALILIHSMVEYPLWYGPFQMTFGLSLGLLLQQGAGPVPTASAHGASRLLASLFAAAIVYAAWDYHRVSQIYLAPEARGDAWRDDTLDKIRPSWLFGNQVRFAQLTIEPLTSANAAEQFAMSGQLLHYSPEPRVIEKRLESALLLRRDDEALWQLARFRAAFPTEAQAWLQIHRTPASAGR